MKRALICISVMMCLTGCAKIPYIGSWFETKPVQHVEEKVIEDVAETALDVAGQDAHVEVDIDHTTDPKCMHCPFHCPTEQ